MVVKANMHKQNVTICSPKPTRMESNAAAVRGTPISQPCGVVPDSNNSRIAGLAKQSFDITPDVRITSAVIVHIINVSMIVPSIAIIP